MPFKSRRTENLRRGRISIPGARYFLTWCTENRAHSLTESRVRATTLQVIETLQTSENARVLAASIMPDHIHLLVELGAPLSVSQIVGKVKSAIARVHREVKWQNNFFEHQLRSEDKVEDFAFYIFMNPYCAGARSLEQSWPGWLSAKNFRWEFESKLRSGGLPQCGWIEQAERFGANLPRSAD